ncbi:MAG: hypothetical protein U1E71_06850 [Ramlibacter sp.]
MSQSIQIPVSVGELFDKQTILQIKCDRIDDPAKRAHAVHELELLTHRADDMLAGCPIRADIVALVAELHAVNAELWDLENIVRACERAARFDSDFVATARRIYAGNDRRAAIKLRINTLLGSDIVEVKSHR